MAKKMTKTMRNQHGIEIKKCCASCQHKCIINKYGTRLCALMQLIVESRFVCLKWECMEKLQNAGNSGGQVKTHDYLMYAMEVRLQEEKAVMDGLITEQQRLSVEEIRTEFEAKFNRSVYYVDR